MNGPGMHGAQALLGGPPLVFLLLTVIFMGGCAAMAGQALARTWRPFWQVVPYALLLGGADRFLSFAMFHGELLSVAGYLRDSAVLLIFAASLYRATRASQMATQYPWLYKRSGPFHWRARDDGQ